jgi:colicin import membrane protein
MSTLPPGRPGISYDEVAAAADRLTARGELPTAKSLRLELGSGSLGTIQRHVTTWRDTQRTTPRLSESLPAELHRMLLACIERERVEARAELEAELQLCRRERDELTLELERQAGELEAAGERIATLTADLAQETGARAELERVVSEVHADVAVIRADAEAARRTAALAEQRLEDLPLLRQHLDEERGARRQAEIEAAELRGRLAQ